MNYQGNTVSGKALTALLSFCLLHLTAFGQTAPTPTVVPIGTLGGNTTTAYAVNAAGVVVGESETASGESHAFILRNGTMYDISPAGGSSAAFAVNRVGQVAGRALFDGEVQGFVYRDNSFQLLGTMGGLESAATVIKDSGWVGGWYGDSWLHRAFVYNGTPPLDLGTLGGFDTRLRAMNNLGWVAGEATIPGNQYYHPFLWKDGLMLDLGTLGGVYITVTAINDLGWVVGSSSLEGDSVTHAFLYDGTTMHDLGRATGADTFAYAVNNRGQIAGDFWIGWFPVASFFYENNSMTELANLGGTYTTVYAMNEQGQVVGSGDDASWNSHALLWENGVLTDLNTFVPPGSGWVLETAWSISDGGHILASGTRPETPSGGRQWFLITLNPTTGNQQPVANAGPDQTVECARAGTSVALDGSASSDPDGDQLTYEWFLDGQCVATGVRPTLLLANAAYSLTLRVTDSAGAQADDSVSITVVDTTAPLVSCPNDENIAADGQCQAVVPNLMAATSMTDACTPAAQLVATQQPPPGTVVSLGRHTVLMEVKDAAGNMASCTALLRVVDAAPPRVSCPAEVTVAADGQCQAVVPNLLALTSMTDACTPADQLVASQRPPRGTVVGLGAYRVQLVVADAAGNTANCTTLLRVVDTTPPQVTCPAEVTVAADGQCQAVVPNLLNAAVVADACTPTAMLVTSQQPAPGTVVGLGTYRVQLVVTDAAGNAARCATALRVVDATPPQVLSLTVAPSELSPINRKMMPVVLTAVAQDNCDPAPVCRIVAILSNEPVTGRNDKTTPDWEITGPLTANVRAESAQIDRVYTIVVRCTDAAGNTSRAGVALPVRKK